MAPPPLNLAVIVASTREGRFGPTVAQWFVGHAGQREDMNVDVIDLADLDLPAALPRRRDPDMESYVKRIEFADAYVVVTPEYNHGYPASVKQAIDLPHDEWKAKAVGFVSYGGMAGGLRAVEQLRQVFAELHVATMRDTVSFHQFFELFDTSGQLKDPTGPAAAATIMLDQLWWWGNALRAGRAAGGPP
ncbi:MAG: NAD(P)H-dependent oxidoreductase [Actinomycetota bacterium]|nr:NAD(P)H-dependent oxidoreductase [Actinomycetota bacterium]